MELIHIVIGLAVSGWFTAVCLSVLLYRSKSQYNRLSDGLDALKERLDKYLSS